MFDATAKPPTCRVYAPKTIDEFTRETWCESWNKVYARDNVSENNKRMQEKARARKSSKEKGKGKGKPNKGKNKNTSAALAQTSGASTEPPAGPPGLLRIENIYNSTYPYKLSFWYIEKLYKIDSVLAAENGWADGRRHPLKPIAMFD